MAFHMQGGSEPESIGRGKPLTAAKLRSCPTPELDPGDRAAVDTTLAILECGFLAVVSDGEVDEDELHAMGECVAAWMGEEVTYEMLEDLFERFGDQVVKEGFDARLQALGKTLSGKAVRDVAFDFACHMAAANGEIVDDEAELLGSIGEALGMTKDEAAARFEAILESYGKSAKDG